MPLCVWRHGFIELADYALMPMSDVRLSASRRAAMIDQKSGSSAHMIVINFDGFDQRLQVGFRKPHLMPGAGVIHIITLGCGIIGV